MLPDLVRAVGEKTDVTITKVTSVRTLCQVINTAPVNKNLFSEVHKLWTLYLTVPVTKATGERSYSTLRRLKTYLYSILCCYLYTSSRQTRSAADCSHF